MRKIFPVLASVMALTLTLAVSASAKEDVTVISIEGPSDYQVGQHLPDGTTVKTGEKTKLYLRFGKDVASIVKPGSEGVLTLRNGQDWEFVLNSGAILSAVKNPKKRANHFTVRTKTATMGVRGTAFYAREEAGKPTYLCSCHGRVEAKDKDGKTLQDIESKHHDTPIFLGDAPKDAKPVMGHTDAEISGLERLLEL